jgi:hypothetical protein
MIKLLEENMKVNLDTGVQNTHNSKNTSSERKKETTWTSSKTF